MNMKEIGGYFGLEQLNNNEYYDNLIALNLARNALLYLLEARSIKKIFIPYYLCDSISEVCHKHGYEIDYYNISKSFMPQLNKVLSKHEYLYIVNYYGQINDCEIKSLKKKYSNIIIDNSQAFFQRPIAGIDTLYSCRKFFGVTDGGYLSTDIRLSREINIDISMDRVEHLLGRHENRASDYYSFFLSNEESLNKVDLKYMSKLTHNILGAIDYESVKRIRNENYAYLESRLVALNKLKLTLPDGAFTYPLLVDDGMEKKKRLAKKGIYIPTLWPNVLINTPEGSVEKDYTKNILPIPCDQRYGKDEMEYLIAQINLVGKDLK